MKKLILSALALLLISGAAWSQSLEDNEYFQKMLELRDYYKKEGVQKINKPQRHQSIREDR